jgi:hypothetical protein
MEFEQSPRDCIENLLNLGGTDRHGPVEWNTKNRDPLAYPMLVTPALWSRHRPLTPGVLSTPEKKNSSWSTQKKIDES